MINRLRLKNFRQHIDRTFDFTAGINVLRGRPEAGKSTVTEAIAYAFFGARSLRESLAETVTWGEPEGSLRVVLDFTFDGVVYNLYRAKSGCELTYDGGRVTGQSDVSRFIETLLGVNADTASRLMLAEQNNLRGSLTAGPTATVQLIETLAGFSLMDDLICKIQEQLPCGSPVAAQTRIDQAQAAIAAAVPDQPPTLDLSPDLEVQGAVRQRAAAEKALAELAEVEGVARHAVKARQNREAGNVVHQDRLDRLLTETQKVPVRPAISEAQVETWLREAGDRKEQAKLWTAYSKPVPRAEVSWEGSRASFKAATVLARKALADSETTLRGHQQSIREAKLLKINEKACAFCKKSLEDVPEVALLNAEQDTKVIALESLCELLRGAIAALQEDIASYTELEQVDALIYKGFPESFWGYKDTMPAEPYWLETVPTDPAGGEDVGELAQRALAGWRGYHSAQALHETRLAEAAELKSQLAKPLPDVAIALETLEGANLARAALQIAERELTLAEAKAALALANYQSAKRDYERQVRDHRSAQATLALAMAELTALATHNELIKKIRSVRPVVAATLWGSVLAAISHYFTQIRGEPSVVTRASGGFQVNGRGVAGLSGSTLDSLGLALRLAVTKTFLPNVGLLMLDEPASGCNDDREISMLGVVATTGFEQVLLVTHSDLADSFAANLIQI